MLRRQSYIQYIPVQRCFTYLCWAIQQPYLSTVKRKITKLDNTKVFLLSTLYYSSLCIRTRIDCLSESAFRRNSGSSFLFSPCICTALATDTHTNIEREFPSLMKSVVTRPLCYVGIELRQRCPFLFCLSIWNSYSKSFSLHSC